MFQRNPDDTHGTQLAGRFVLQHLAEARVGTGAGEIRRIDIACSQEVDAALKAVFGGHEDAGRELAFVGGGRYHHLRRAQLAVFHVGLARRGGDAAKVGRNRGEERRMIDLHLFPVPPVEPRDVQCQFRLDPLKKVPAPTRTTFLRASSRATARPARRPTPGAAAAVCHSERTP